MKKSLLFLVLISFLGSCSSGADASEEITLVLDKQVAEWNKGNIDGYMEGYWNNDSLLFIGRRGPTYGYATTLANYKKGYPDTGAMGKLSFSGLRFNRLSDDCYQVVGGWLLERDADAPGGYFTLIFKKLNGKWVIVSDHTS